MSDWFTLRWADGAVELLDQRRLPAEETYLTLHNVEDVARAIEDLAVRGAPAIGCAAACSGGSGADVRAHPEDGAASASLH